jgi:hypothetical protein
MPSTHQETDLAGSKERREDQAAYQKDRQAHIASTLRRHCEDRRWYVSRVEKYLFATTVLPPPQQHTTIE